MCLEKDIILLFFFCNQNALSCCSTLISFRQKKLQQFLLMLRCGTFRNSVNRDCESCLSSMLTNVCFRLLNPSHSQLIWLLFVGFLTSQQHASVSQGRTCTDNFTCFHTEIEVAGQTFHLTQSQYTDKGLTSPSTDPITPGVW